MTYTKSEIIGACQLVDEYNEAYERGEEPHFPQEAWGIVQADATDRRKAFCCNGNCNQGRNCPARAKKQ